MTVHTFYLTNEVQIAREIIRCGGYDWVIRLYNDGLFSPAQLDKKAEYRAWPLLEIFASWVESDDEQAQVAAVGFLNSITTEQINNLFLKYGSLDPNGIGYVYKVKADTFTKIDTWQWVSSVPVVPEEVTIIKVSDYINTVVFSEEAKEIQKKLYP